ncbi:MAG: ATP synthase F1 subunit delta [Thermoguttaceae bacterium]|nr:ATP synthase F1 subunit delta [Thermoguttaceae bacterium]
MKQNIEQDARFAAELDADATREKLADVYAVAVLGACETFGVATDDFLEEFDSFVEAACDPFPKFEEILASAMVPTDEKLRIVAEICRDASPVFANFLKTLVKRGRTELLRDVRRGCRRIAAEREGRVAVKVTTAVPLSETAKANLAAKLRELVGGEPELSVVVDPETIGGVIVRVGDTIYDASIATQLNNARQEMIDRSAHEIQSRRDCFRYSEGN